MSRSRVGLWVVATLIALGSLSLAGDEMSPDLKALQGTWRLAGGECKGKALTRESLDPLKGQVNVIRGDVWEVWWDNRRLSTRRLKLDENTSPKQIDFGPAKLADGSTRDKGQEGIYRFDGAAFHYATMIPIGQVSRPKSFDTGEDGRVMLMKLERVDYVNRSND